jgi:4-amino-4-deoxy-L-arabinose transferase-like glycosyltransferase
MLKIEKSELVFLLAIFTIALGLRIYSIYPFNTILGFDQARDLWDATTIFRDHNLRIIGPTAGNNPNLHHGILFLYYLIPPLVIFGGNPTGVTLWNSLFNAANAIVLYFLGKSLFGRKSVGIIAAIIAAVSYQLIQYSGWISNPTVTIITTPIYFGSLWAWYKGKKWGLPTAAFFLGLSIQFELFFLYLIPTLVLYWLLIKPPKPSKKILLLSISLLCISTSTMILTEIKFGFGGIKSILGAGRMVGGGATTFFDLLIKFSQRWNDFYLNLWPTQPDTSVIIGVFIVSLVIYELLSNKNNKIIKKRNIFILLYFFSPAIMLLLGYHNAPWFLIGRPSSAILLIAYLLSKLKSRLLLAAALLFIVVNNIQATIESRDKGQVLLEPDPGALMSDQVAIIDYTYQQSHREPFAITTVTNPLYVNALWSYHYYWYGKSHYSYVPSWLGGIQLYPYNTLPQSSETEKYWYVIIDDTPRIPVAHKLAAISSVQYKTTLVEEKKFGGLIVQKRIKQ